MAVSRAGIGVGVGAAVAAIAVFAIVLRLLRADRRHHEACEGERELANEMVRRGICPKCRRSFLGQTATHCASCGQDIRPRLLYRHEFTILSWLIIPFWVATMVILWASWAPAWRCVQITLWGTFICGCGLLFDRARARDLRRKERMKNGLCVICGYDVRDHRHGDRCPECGGLI